MIEAVKATVGRRAARGGFELRHRDDIVQLACVKAQAMAERHPDPNLNAVAGLAVNQAGVDLWRSKFRRDGELDIAVVEENARLPQGPEDYVNVRLGENTEAAVLRKADEARRRRFAAYLSLAAADERESRDRMHTSARFLKAEERTRAMLLLRLLMAAQPTHADRTLVQDAFCGDDHSLAELGRMNGVSKVAVHKHLNGYTDQLGFIGAHFRNMDTRILEHLCAEVENDASTVPLDQLVRAAANYASMHSVHSPEHAEVARDIASHLAWIERNLPGRHRNLDRICRNIVRGAAQYVILRNDAHDDMLHERGLWDDRKVARAALLCGRSAVPTSPSSAKG
ncbi:MAG: hypothetical protein ACKOD2_13250 [Ilumatobacteraceae bacterium]